MLPLLTNYTMNMIICKLRKVDNIYGKNYGEYPVEFDGYKLQVKFEGRDFEQLIGVNSAKPLSVVPALIRKIELRYISEGHGGWFLQQIAA